MTMTMYYSYTYKVWSFSSIFINAAGEEKPESGLGNGATIGKIGVGRENAAEKRTINYSIAGKTRWIDEGTVKLIRGKRIPDQRRLAQRFPFVAIDLCILYIFSRVFSSIFFISSISFFFPLSDRWSRSRILHLKVEKSN